MKVNGIMRFPSDVENELIEVEGILILKGNLKTKRYNGNGICRCKKDISADELNMEGLMSIGGDLVGKNVKFTGVMKVNKVMADEFTFTGKLSVKECVNCEKFTADFSSKSNIGDIEGSIVQIHKNPKSFRRMILSVNTITADEIYLENVDCDYVSGDKIKLGPNCKIQRLSYKTELQVHHSSIVNQQTKM